MKSILEHLRVHPPVAGNWSKEAGAKYLIAIDIDGTLVLHDGTLHDSVRDAVRDVLAAGHHVVIATGRSRQATIPITDAIGISRGYVVTSNGAVTLSVAPKYPEYYKVIDTVTFNPTRALKVLSQKLPTAQMALEAPNGELFATGDFQDGSFGTKTTRMSREELVQIDTAVRVVLFAEDIDAVDFKKAIYDVGLHGVNYAVGWSAWLDIAAHGVSKATALENIRRHLGIDPAHTIAIGDGHNDKEMLHWAARGVAMGEAPDEVIAVASEVTLSVYEDGVVPVLRSLL